MNRRKILKTTEVPEDTEKIEKDSLTEEIIGCAIEVYRNLDPELLESTYQQCLARELTIHKIKFYCQPRRSGEKPDGKKKFIYERNES